ncbi:hypothetical protein Tco_0126994 [Tanacetum coccineum]
MAPKRATKVNTRSQQQMPDPTAPQPLRSLMHQLNYMTKVDSAAFGHTLYATMNGNDKPYFGTGVRGSDAVARECHLLGFHMNENLCYFKGTEEWLSSPNGLKNKDVFRISNCSVENQIKFSTCTLLAGALTWWNFHVMTVTHDVAYAMTCDSTDCGQVQPTFHQELAQSVCKDCSLRSQTKLKVPLQKDKLKTRGSLKTLPETIKINNNNKIRGRTQARPTLQAIVTGNHTLGLNLCVLSVITIMKVLVYLSAVTARGLAIWPRIVEADLQMLTTTTATTTIIIRREMVAMRAELKDILEETAQD